jgi:hypothetical protein
MAHKEWCLRPGERLNTNEYLRSKNGLFYAVMQEDGNFVTYRGDWWESGQNTSMWNLFGLGRVRDHIHDYLISHVDGLPRSFSADMQTDSNFCINLRSQGGKVLWCTKGGRDWPEYGDNCWAVMQDDGNFCIKRPDDGSTGGRWNTNAGDSLDEKNSQFTEIVYDFKNRIVKAKGVPQSSAKSTAINKTEINQSSTLSLVYTESKASGWKKTSTLKIGLKVGFKLGVPATTGEGSVEASFEASKAFEENETTTKTEQKTITLPVVVPPGKGVIGQVTWSDSTITLPFRLKGMGTFKSGIRAPISLNGMYEGIATTDVTTTWIPYTEKEEASARAMLMAAPRTVLP